MLILCKNKLKNQKTKMKLQNGIRTILKIVIRSIANCHKHNSLNEYSCPFFYICRIR